MLSEKRNGRITASAVGAILGVAPYATRADVMRRMVREYHGLPSEFEGNVATEYGTFNEKNALFDFELLTGLDVESENDFYIAKEIEWLGATPDGFCSDESILEIKCPYGLRNDKEPHFKTLFEQPHYYAQVQTQLFCTGKKTAYFFQWNQYAHFLEKVDFDASYFEQVLISLSAFYSEYLTVRESSYQIHLDEPIAKIDAPLFVSAYLQAKENMKQAEDALERAKQDLIKLANGKKSEIGGILVYQVEREGSISYAKALKDIAPTADLDAYRGKGSSYWVVK